MKNLLEVKDLKVYFYTDDGVIPAVDGVSFEVKPGEVIGIVGESGCGKSVTAMSLLRLIPNPPGKIIAGTINFAGVELTALNDQDMTKIRGNDIAMIFQEPMTSLNPVYTIGNQIGEAIRLHQGLRAKETREKCLEMLKLAGIPRAEKVVNEYPYSLSGGMRQRVMIAMALSCNPRLLIADEPTSSLDVTIQAQILELLKGLKGKSGASVMFISHDLAVVAEMAEHVVVMYSGKIVEDTDVQTLLKNPKHPYTVGLLSLKPKLGEEKEKLEPIQGAIPDPLNMPAGCHFHPRCRHMLEVCSAKMPPLFEAGPGHKIRCWLFKGRD